MIEVGECFVHGVCCCMNYVLLSVLPKSWIKKKLSKQ